MFKFRETNVERLKKSRIGECATFTNGKERILSEQKSLHEFLEKKAGQAFQGEIAAQTRFSEAQTELDRRAWERRNGVIALYDIGLQLQSQTMELY